MIKYPNIVFVTGRSIKRFVIYVETFVFTGNTVSASKRHSRIIIILNQKKRFLNYINKNSTIDNMSEVIHFLTRM